MSVVKDKAFRSAAPGRDNHLAALQIKYSEESHCNSNNKGKKIGTLLFIFKSESFEFWLSLFQMLNSLELWFLNNLIELNFPWEFDREEGYIQII